MLSDRMLGGYSAYSNITYELCTRFAELGHSVAHIPMGVANLMGRQIFQKVLIYESGNDPFGEDVALSHYLDFKGDILITNKEVWNFQHIYRMAINWAPICPIDHSPVSSQITARLATAFRVIAQSRHGESELRQKNVDCVYIPLGVRTDVFKPLPKAECKKAFYMEPDDFVVGVVAMNRSRKMIPHMLRGYKRFLEWNPDVKNAHLFLWTCILPRRPPADVSMGVADVGVHLLPEIFELGLGTPPNDVRWIEPNTWEKLERAGGLPILDPKGQWDMVRLYNSFDVLLGATGGEGAGLPYLESAACGVPSIYTNYAAAPEYAGSCGLPVNPSDYVILNTPGTRYMIPDVDEMAEALTKLYNADREQLAKRARIHAEKYDWRKIIRDYWVPFLMECEEELYPKITEAGVSSWA